ncbi:MAG TPA: YbaY family lipoprotein [Terriglobia bacterium]
MRKLGLPVNENQWRASGLRAAPDTTQAALGRARDGAEISALSENVIPGFPICGLALLVALLCLVIALPAGAQDSEWLYHCPDGSMFFASGGPDTATLHAFGNTWQLPITVSADGARYSDGHITFWNRGYTALVERDGKLEFHDCLYTPPGSSPPSAAQDQQANQLPAVTGTATYRERIALPPKSALIVYVEEGDVPAGPSKVIAEQRISIEHQVPIGFAVRYDASRIQPRGRYQVAARIVDGDRVLFVTDGSYPVISGYPNHVDLLLKRAAASPEAGAAPAGDPSSLSDTS